MPVTYLETSRDLYETDSILFGAALAVCRIIGAKFPTAGRATRKISAIPAWTKRIEDRIANARALIGRLTSFYCHIAAWGKRIRRYTERLTRFN